MNLNCNLSLGDRLSRNTQRARVITEAWLGAEGYCLNCDSNRLEQTPPSTIARDFTCSQCNQPYELKAAARAHTRSVQDGGFDAMMRRIRAHEAPTLMLMHYSPEWRVKKLIAIHPVFLTPAVVRKRLQPVVRPKGGQEYWMCKLDLTVIPSDGKIVIVDGVARPQGEARKEFRESMRFAEIPVTDRGWTTLVLTAVRRLGRVDFATSDIYPFANMMRAVYPGNNNIEPKIRQQLQHLVRFGYLERTARGKYHVLR